MSLQFTRLARAAPETLRMTTPRTSRPASFSGIRLLLASPPRRWYNYEPSNGRRQGQQSKQQRVYQGIPVSPQEMPPRSSFEDGGYYSPSQQSYSYSGEPWPRGRVGRVVRSTGMRRVVLLAMAGALIFYFTHLEVVPVSGRRRFNCFDEDSMRMLGEMQYEALMEEAKEQGQVFLSDYDPRTLVVRHVMNRLIPVSGMSATDNNWEIRVIDDPKTVNAFVLPGGKVFVFSGLFSVARNEDSLAAVLGHELAHNLANHHGERASSAIGTTILLTSAFFLSAGLAYFVLRPVIDLAFNTPMSRRQESEADYIGLMLMAEACYNPEEAADFWGRMDKAQDFQPPEIVSTHPSNKHRQEKIREWMPLALDKRQQSACNGTQGFAEQFKRAMRQGVLIVS